MSVQISSKWFLIHIISSLHGVIKHIAVNMFSIKLSVLFLQLLATNIASDIMYSADQSTECINKKIKERSRFNDPYVRVLNFNLKNVYWCMNAKEIWGARK